MNPYVKSFDQRGQKVNYQYNFAGNINLGQPKDKSALILCFLS